MIFDKGGRAYLIAEIGNNHEGSYTLAEEMIGKAVEAGADAVKFQTFQTEHYVSRENPARFERLKGFELTYDQFAQLAKTTKVAGVDFISTPFDVASARFLGGIADAIKISSSDNNFWALLEAAAETDLPLIISGGLASAADLAYSKALITRNWASRGVQQDCAVLHCVTAYPVPPEQAGLAAIRVLQREVGGIIGYSDHTMGIDACLYAAAMGAQVIEKHFTIDKNYSDFRDHQLSADPEEFKALVDKIAAVAVLLGAEEKTAKAAELELKPHVRRSIAVHRDVPKGETLSWDDLTWIRPASGMAPGREGEVLGRPLNQSLNAGDILKPEMFETNR